MRAMPRQPRRRGSKTPDARRPICSETDEMPRQSAELARCRIAGPDVGPLQQHRQWRQIGLGRAHKGRQVKLLIADQSIRVITPEGELISELTLDPDRNHQPLTRA
jgi:hypothetical protein